MPTETPKRKAREPKLTRREKRLEAVLADVETERDMLAAWNRRLVADALAHAPAPSVQPFRCRYPGCKSRVTHEHATGPEPAACEGCGHFRSSHVPRCCFSNDSYECVCLAFVEPAPKAKEPAAHDRLVEAARGLAMLVLQSRAYADPDTHDAVDEVLDILRGLK